MLIRNTTRRKVVTPGFDGFLSPRPTAALRNERYVEPDPKLARFFARRAFGSGTLDAKIFQMQCLGESAVHIGTALRRKADAVRQRTRRRVDVERIVTVAGIVHAALGLRRETRRLTAGGTLRVHAYELLGAALDVLDASRDRQRLEALETAMGEFVEAEQELQQPDSVVRLEHAERLFVLTSLLPALFDVRSGQRKWGRGWSLLSSRLLNVNDPRHRRVVWLILRLVTSKTPSAGPLPGDWSDAARSLIDAKPQSWLPHTPAGALARRFWRELY